MTSVLTRLQDSGIPTRSAVAAIQHISNRGRQTADYYNKSLSNLVDAPVQITDEHLARFTYLYTVQGIVDLSMNTDIIDATEVMHKAMSNAKKYLKENPWTVAEPDEVVKTDAAGKPKRKKGAKQEEAGRIYNENKDTLDRKQIIEMFIKELDMSKSGATTYFYNMRKKFGE